MKITEPNARILMHLLIKKQDTKTEMNKSIGLGYGYIHFRLKEFEEEDLVKIVNPKAKKDILYELTPKGKEFAKAMKTLLA